MARYLVQTRETTFIKGYGFLSFSKCMVKDISKNISRSFSRNLLKNLLIMLENLQQMHLKLLPKRVIQKTAEAAGDLIGNIIADRITKFKKLHHPIV